MRERQPVSRERIAERVAGDPLLTDFVAPFPDLGRGRECTPLASLQRIAELLGGRRKAAHIQFTLSEGTAVRRWCLALTPRGCKAAEREHKRPNLELVTAMDVWAQVATGQLSLLEAFGQGKLRARGDIELARFMVRKLHRD